MSEVEVGVRVWEHHPHTLPLPPKPRTGMAVKREKDVPGMSL